MKEKMRTTGLIFNELLLWEKGSPGRTGISLPRYDVENAPLDEKLVGDSTYFPDLSEIVRVMRSRIHYFRLRHDPFKWQSQPGWSSGLVLKTQKR